MSKNWTNQKLKKWIKEGRGQGSGLDYKPWITTQDVASKGVSIRTKGVKIPRMYEFLSKQLYHYFILLEWQDSVIDIREAYPLLDFDNLIGDKADLNIYKFSDNKNKTPYIFTTSFLIDISFNGKTSQVARTVKYKSSLKQKKTQDQLEIQRRYWNSKGIEWGLVTNEEMTNYKQLIKNIDWCRSTYNIKDYPTFLNEDIDGLKEVLKYKLETSNCSIDQCLMDLEFEFSLTKGMGLILFKHMIITKYFNIDMNSVLDTKFPLK